LKEFSNEQELTNAMEFEVTDDSPVLLCTVSDHMELAAVEALLRSYHIPVMKKWHNAGDVAMIYMAVSFLGADIFVPSKLLEKAKEILEAESLEEESVGFSGDNFDCGDIDGAEYAQLKEEHEKIRRERAQLMAFVFVFPLFVGLVVFALYLIGLILGSCLI